MNHFWSGPRFSYLFSISALDYCSSSGSYSPLNSELLNHSVTIGKSSFSTTLKFTVMPSSNLQSSFQLVSFFQLLSFTILRSLFSSILYRDFSFRYSNLRACAQVASVVLTNRGFKQSLSVVARKEVLARWLSLSWFRNSVPCPFVKSRPYALDVRFVA